MIVVEGPDGAGKTTLAREVCTALNMEYRRPPVELLSSEAGPSGIGLVEWWQGQLRMARSVRRRGVYDRCFWISDPIYQAAQVERDLIVPPEELWRGIADLWADNVAIVWCMPPMDVQYSNVIQDGRASLKGLEFRHLEKVNNLYWAFMALWGQASFEYSFHYDYTKHSIDFVIEKLEALGYGPKSATA